MPAGPRRRRRSIFALTALLALAAALAAAAGLDWRAGKVARLTPPPPHAAPAPMPLQPILLLFGDSRVHGWAPLPTRDFPIIRVGYPGESAIRLAPVFAQEIRRQRPAAAMLQLGINDAVAASLVSPARRRQALADTEAAIALMARDAQAAEVALTIQLIVPPIEPTPWRHILYGNRVNSYVRTINAAITHIARRYDARVVNPMYVLEENGMIPKIYRKDSLHFSAEAYRQLNILIPEHLD